MPNFLITEYFVNFEEAGQAIARPSFRVEQGRIALPTTPGLGLELDEDALARHPYRPRPLRPWPRPAEE
jgi:galactonate dehydratase